MPVAILYRPELAQYDFGPGHPFRGDRYHVFPPFLKQRLPEDNNYRMLAAEAATEEDLLLICDKDYIEFTRSYFEEAAAGKVPDDSRFYRYHSMDNHPSGRPGRLEEAARTVVGQAKYACDLVQQGQFPKAVSIGGGLHHAHRAYGEGFCLYNDVAFCATYLLKQYGLERVLVLDTDAHAGNGTSDYFYEDPRVLLIDLHQDPATLYPGSGFANEIGSGRGAGFTVNIPMPLYASNDSYKLAFETIVAPVAAEFKPQVIVRNGGSDPHFADTLTNLGLTVAGFKMLGEKTNELARTLCGGREIDLIASGYNKDVLPYAWLALLSGVAGFGLAVEEPVQIPARLRQDSSLPRTEKVLEEVRRNLKDYWACFR